MKAALVISIGGLLMFNLPAQSHHSFLAQYDMDIITTITGTVTEVWYQNPHTRVYMEEDTGEGDTRVWEMETYPRNVLVRRGWKHSDLSTGREQ